MTYQIITKLPDNTGEVYEVIEVKNNQELANIISNEPRQVLAITLK